LRGSASIPGNTRVGLHVSTGTGYDDYFYNHGAPTYLASRGSFDDFKSNVIAFQTDTVGTAIAIPNTGIT